MDIITYWAKSPTANGKQTTVKQHLEDVAKLAAQYGCDCGLSEEAQLCGKLHDFGKYSERFQGVLAGTHQNIDHAFCSAALLYPCVKKRPITYGPVLEAINGHHNGLVAWRAVGDLLDESLHSDDVVTCLSGKCAALAGVQYIEAQAVFQSEFPDFVLPALPRRTPKNTVEDMLDTRMLFSCLVDADYSASAQEDDSDYCQKVSGESLDACASLQALSQYYENLRAGSTADKQLNAIRTDVFEQCGLQGEQPTGLFTLTAPTGVGKTLALLHFALRHCVRNGLRRIILVLPFLTLAEQCEKTYSEIVADILVDHSQKDLPEEARELASCWDAPIIITTSVKFFESLFSDRPTECRKLHSIAGSVVIFDEAQSLPAELTLATVQAVNRLCERYRCSMVFSTATQPDFSAIPDAKWNPIALIPENSALYDKLRRVNVAWRLSEKTQLEQIADEMAEEASVCAILNLRRHAAALYAHLEQRTPADELFYLTTDLCPAHRLAVVETIKQRLKDGLPCRVVATQCIEAGVDLDFAAMYRALAPLEAIIQAAGRCNRNGKLPEGGRVVVFEPAEAGKQYPDAWYEHAAMTVKNLLARGGGALNIDDPAVISRYYQELLHNATEKKKLKAAIAAKAYAEVHKEYQLIARQGVQVIVPWQGNPALFAQVREEALKTGLTPALLRKAAPITVSTFDEAIGQHAEQLCFARKKGGAIIKSDSYLLNIGHEDCYDNHIGLKFKARSLTDCFA